jgi:8-oxo-dGTP pyrophosphatase MutT (NUDIX family)
MVDELLHTLAGRTPLLLPPDPTRRQAAVLLPLFKNPSDYHLVLTQRTDTLTHHRGQIAFPGGSFDPSDENLLTTALRESFEEVGIRPQDVRVLGRLDDLVTFSTPFTISPFVGLIPASYPFRRNPLEVATVFDVPLSRLNDPAVFRRYTRTREDGATVVDYEYHVGGYVVWGMTGRLIHHFLQVIEETGPQLEG